VKGIWLEELVNTDAGCADTGCSNTGTGRLMLGFVLAGKSNARCGFLDLWGGRVTKQVIEWHK